MPEMRGGVVSRMVKLLVGTLALLLPVIADAPVLEWRLIPVEWVEVNLCAEPCMYKARWVKKYEWEAR